MANKLNSLESDREKTLGQWKPQANTKGMLAHKVDWVRFVCSVGGREKGFGELKLNHWMSSFDFDWR